MLNRIKTLLFENINKVNNGCIIASPTKENPDYFYHWIRDGAIVMNSIIDLYYLNKINFDDLVIQFTKYINFEENLLYLDSICHRGEPKFNVNMTSFDDNWGRPQNDGPALRSLVLIKYCNILISKNQSVKKLYDGIFPSKSIIKNDLEYICQTYKNKSFDIWEEIFDYNYFTLIVQYKALLEGSKFAFQQNDTRGGTKYLKISNYIKQMLEMFKDKYLISHLTDKRKTKNIDTSIVIGHVLTGDLHNTFLLKTIIEIIKINKELYPINQNLKYPLIGRYDKDHYYDGNPWILTTVYIVICLKIFAKYDFYIDEEFDWYLAKIVELLGYQKNYKNIKSQLDDIVNDYTQLLFDIAEENEWAEQIDKNTQKGVSAKYLTWNFASFINLLKF